MKPVFTSISHKVKALLHRKQWKEALIFFYFILLASGFWIMQSLQQEYEIDIHIPLRYKNIPKEIAFNENPPQFIEIKLRDRGSILLNYTFGRKFAPIDINVKEQLARPYRLLIDKKEIENDVKKQLMATTHIISLDPTEINLTLSKRIEKQLPVVFEGEIKTQPGFKLSGAVQIHPEQITAYASQQILDTLSVVHTVNTSIQKANKRITQTLQIQPIEGVTFDPSTVSITVPVEEFTEKVLEVPVICSDIPAHYRVRMFPASIKVSVSVPLSLFKGLSTDQFAIDIPFAELEQNTSGVIPIKLTRKPEGIDKAILSPERIEFIIEQASGS